MQGGPGRLWLAELELAEEERESVDAAIRQIEFLDSEIAEVERLVALAGYLGLDPRCHQCPPRPRRGELDAGATPGRASRGPSSGQAARQNEAPNPAL